MIAQAELKSVLHYEPETGVFTWLARRGQNSAGSEAGSAHSQGYVTVKYQGRHYYAHRLAWLYVTGYWPENQIDHRNRIKSDNRFDNLRDVTPSINQLNHIRAQAGNRSGFRGVTQIASGFKANIKLKPGERQLYLGTFRTGAEAHQAYLTAKNRQG